MGRTLGAKEPGWSDVTKNILRGCSENCLYCWAAALAERRNQKTRADWPNAELNERAYREIMNRRLPYRIFKNGEPQIARIMFPSTHNITEEFLLESINVLRKFCILGNPVLIVIKPRQKVVESLCRALAEFKEQVEFRITSGSLFPNVIQAYEQNTSLPLERIVCAKHIVNQGFELSFSVEPYLDHVPVVPALIMLLQTLTSKKGVVWLGPMNKELCPSELWDEDKWGVTAIQRLYSLIQGIPKIDQEKLMLKDSFRNALGKKLVSPSLVTKPKSNLLKYLKSKGG